MSTCRNDVDMLTGGRIVSSLPKRAHEDWNWPISWENYLKRDWSLKIDVVLAYYGSWGLLVMTPGSEHKFSLEQLNSRHFFKLGAWRAAKTPGMLITYFPLWSFLYYILGPRGRAPLVNSKNRGHWPGLIFWACAENSFRSLRQYYAHSDGKYSVLDLPRSRYLFHKTLHYGMLWNCVYGALGQSVLYCRRIPKRVCWNSKSIWWVSWPRRDAASYQPRNLNS